MIVTGQTQAINTPSIQTGTTALSANNGRVGFVIQNVGTNPLFILLGTGASSSVFHVVLQAGTADSDGKGGIFTMTSGTVYTGEITIAGTSPKYTVTELGN